MALVLQQVLPGEIIETDCTNYRLVHARSAHLGAAEETTAAVLAIH